MTGDTGDGSTVGTSDKIVHAHHQVREMTGPIVGARDLLDLVSRLQGLRSLLVVHFLEEEQIPDGFFDIIRTNCSRHLGKVSQLEEEHRALLETVDQLVERARACLAGPVAEILQEARKLAARLQEHEAFENELLVDTFYVDIGEND